MEEVEHIISVMEDFYRDWRRTRALYLLSLGFVAVGAITTLTLLTLPAFIHSLSVMLWVPAALVMSMMAGIYTAHYRSESKKKQGVIEDLMPYVTARVDSLEDSSAKKVFKARLRRMS